MPDRLDIRRVGIFVDVENLREHVPPGMPWEDVGKALVRYGERFGIVVCRWASLYKANFADPIGVRIALERAEFDVCHPETPLVTHDRKDRADLVIVERIHDELGHTKPEVFIIGSGDHIYREVISSVLKKDFEVRLVSARNSLAGEYLELEAEDRRRRQIDGLEGQKFFVETDVAGILGSVAAQTGEAVGG